MAVGPAGRHVLDRWPARVVAACCGIACLALLGWLHRDDLLPSAVPAADDPSSRCLAARAADIDQMLADRVIKPAQAELFKNRAEALCRAEAGGGGPPGLPVPR